MRVSVFLSLVALTAADSASLKKAEEQGTCIVDGGEAMSELMDSAMFIWAASARCGKKGEEVKCEVDITSAIRSVNSMVNIVLKVVDQCGDLHIANKKCTFSALKLSKNTAGLAAATGGLIQKCPGMARDEEEKEKGEGGSKKDWADGSQVLCVVNLKDTAKSLFTSVKAMMKMRKGCKNLTTGECAENALKLVAALAGLGEYMSGAVGHCTHHRNEEPAECSEEVNMLIQELSDIAIAGKDMSRECKPEETGLLATVVEVQTPLGENSLTAAVDSLQTTKLYGKDHPDTFGISSNVLVVALLPVACIVSFFGGRLYANHRTPNDARMMTPRGARIDIDVE